MTHQRADRPLHIVVLAAGAGTRMRSGLPKVLHAVGNRPMLHHCMAAAESLAPDTVTVVVGHGADAVERSVREFRADAETVLQAERNGTGHALQCAWPRLEGKDGDVLVLYADTPLLPPEALERQRAALGDAGIAVLGFVADEPGGYGRLVTGSGGALEAIVEAKDATDAERAIKLCNSGVMAFRMEVLRDHLFELSNENANGEYYLTDLVQLHRAGGGTAVIVECAEEDVLGVNSRIELAQAEAVFQARRRRAAMTEGATLVDPQSVVFSYDTRLGRDVLIEPFVVFGPGVHVADRVRIRAHSHLEGCRLAEGAEVGPFARLRPGAEIGEDARIGNFVEVKKASVERGAKVNHLSYIGDARVGAGANVGAGTITCNYDGFSKHFTDIGEGAFIGSNSALVAPVTVGNGAYVGSGSVISKNIPEDALGVARADQTTRDGWARKFRARKTRSEK